jgi:hypothetical protein
VCVLSTEVHNGGAKLREELVAFVRSNADALVLVVKLYKSGRLLFMQV